MSEPFIYQVTPSGFKPETFSSVVRCSIQLSYGAVSFGIAKIVLSLQSANSFFPNYTDAIKTVFWPSS